jgi:pseudaminic acid synthase
MHFKIGNKIIGDNHPTFIIAELSANHNHNFDIAVKTIKAAKEAGADAIKLQTYTADTITINNNNKYFKIGDGIWKEKTLYDLYKTAYTPWEWQPKLKKIADELGILLFSSPFDKTAVDFLHKMKVPCFKIASFEALDIPLIEYIASKGKPVIISTGMTNLADISEAINACHKMGNKNIAILKCTSIYPAPFEELNLKTIPHMKETFKTPVGFSDHTLGIEAAIAAVSVGAKIIEKHFILDKKLGGPDASFSIDPKELKRMVTSIRNTEKALGEINYNLSPKSKKSAKFARSLFIVEDIKKGDPFTEKNIRSIRPGFGIPPKYINIILGKKAKKNFKKGTPVTWDII